jgi:hypothetical protein
MFSAEAQGPKAEGQGPKENPIGLVRRGACCLSVSPMYPDDSVTDVSGIAAFGLWPSA